MIANTRHVATTGAAAAIFRLHRRAEIDIDAIGQRRQPGQHIGELGGLFLWRAANDLRNTQARRPNLLSNGTGAVLLIIVRFWLFQDLSHLSYADTQLRCQYPQKSTLGLFRIASATTRSTCAPFGSRR